MSTYLINANSISVYPGSMLNSVKEIPVGVYNVSYSMEQGFFLTNAPDFKLPPKVYGDTETYCNRIINTFRSRDNRNTGVMLLGEKGSGKSLLAKTICSRINLPVLLIGSSFTGSSFKQFIEAIDQPCVVFFDEYEKIYNERKEQWDLLSMFDGTTTSQKLFIFTCNDELSIDSHMMNRPGRVYYLIKFDSISEDAIREYCEEVLVNPEKYTKMILSFAKNFRKFNFDMMAALVEEVNRYDQAPEEFADLINVKPSFGNNSFAYDCTLEIRGNTYKIGKVNVDLYDDDDSVEFAYLFNSSEAQRKGVVFGQYWTCSNSVSWFNEDDYSELMDLYNSGLVKFTSKSEGRKNQYKAQSETRARISKMKELNPESIRKANEDEPKEDLIHNGSCYLSFEQSVSTSYDYNRGVTIMQFEDGIKLIFKMARAS